MSADTPPSVEDGDGHGQPARVLWIGGGLVLLVAAYLLREHPWPLTNVLIPAGAWALLRGAL